MTHNEVFKDIPNQTSIEIRFAQRNIDEISKDEALIRYKKNTNLLGRIFSYKENSEPENLEDLKNEPSQQITPEMLQSTRDEAKYMDDRHHLDLNEFSNTNKKFQQLMNEAKHLKN